MQTTAIMHDYYVSEHAGVTESLQTQKPLVILRHNPYKKIVYSSV